MNSELTFVKRRVDRKYAQLKKECMSLQDMNNQLWTYYLRMEIMLVRLVADDKDNQKYQKLLRRVNTAKTYVAAKYLLPAMFSASKAIEIKKVKKSDGGIEVNCSYSWWLDPMACDHMKNMGI